MQNEVQVFDNLKVKQENGQVMFDAESAAIGLGLTQNKSHKTYVRWETVSKYLSQKVGKGDFITEPQFYKLAIKANNETAERFQDWVTSEVLPSIRQTGGYQLKQLSPTEMLKLQNDSIIEVSEKVDRVEDKVDTYIENQAVNATDYGAISTAVTHRVHQYAAIHHIEKENRGPLFKDLNSQIKQVTGAGNRSRIKSKDYDMVIRFIDTWEPSTATKAIIEQMSLDLDETA
ncbi:ORF6C domain-containing protein [Leuconostoc pseudomesenteroides]|uniref:BRO family protein n=1 Tax=Leuconostoc pseudomesenteroides TaxID=33968 RepID=UPI001B8CF7C7|nr:ORF6C domain-containing protein [Leuconostoc pseudomesenteroides]MBS0957222.1 ORF6C domain-containing protein [Leuconostoc pseudomesenteroides]